MERIERFTERRCGARVPHPEHRWYWTKRGTVDIKSAVTVLCPGIDPPGGAEATP
jgi:hypothetical protein